MSYQQRGQTEYVTGFRVTQPQYDVECPPQGPYPLIYKGIKKCGEFKKFNSNEMGPRCMHAFEIVDPSGKGEDKEWAGTEVTTWFNPVLTSDLANAVKLAKAIDPAWELEYDEVLEQAFDADGNPEFNADGTPRMLTLRDYDYAKNMERLVGRAFMSLVAPNKNGFPNLSGDPWPYTAPVPRSASRRRAGSVTATVLDPEEVSTAPDAVGEAAVDDNFGS